ncbi:MAG TPA: efflux RND transporter periplasmic adaptor subunit, partial [Thermomicrobiales bacterium]|nr:efflux RND transporter periplasmic adaptor subunit [Thermomicrobiales bacterium]
ALQLAEGGSAASPDDEGLRLEALSAARQVDDARRAVDKARAALDSTVVLAPATGTIIELTVRVGDSVTQAQPVARIAGPGDLQLVADVDELDLPNVAPDATVTFRLDAYPERELAGTVRSTAAQARVPGGAAV